MFGQRNATASAAEDWYAPGVSRNVIAPGPSSTPSATRLDPNVAGQRMDRARTAVFESLVEGIDLSELSKLEKDRLHPEICEAVEHIIDAKGLALSAAEQKNLTDDICNDVLGLGPLEPLLADDEISEIMVNDANTVFVERNGLIERTAITFKDDDRLMNLCKRIASSVGRRIDRGNPMCDARLPDGSRVNMIVPPLSIKGPSLTIRKFKKQVTSLREMVKSGSLSAECAGLLKSAMANKVNMLISGGTGSGKTTLLNALSVHIDDGERLVTIEDTAELKLQQPNVVSLEARQDNVEGVGQVTQRDLLVNALRMRPDRIIIGEVRGPEAIDMLQAMNTGHEGSMGTVHANNPTDALMRLENMIALGGFSLTDTSVRRQIASAIGLVVQVARLSDGSRRVVSITEVTGFQDDMVGTQELFSLEHDSKDADGRLVGQDV
jgi:pilus assembly protein CpaF